MAIARSQAESKALPTLAQSGDEGLVHSNIPRLETAYSTGYKRMEGSGKFTAYTRSYDRND